MKTNLNKLKFCIKRTFYIILGLFITYCILWTCNDHLKPFFDYRNDEYTEIIENTEYSDKMKEEAESGILKSQYNLAMAYLDGNGVEKNDSLAFMWFKQYARKSASDGYFLLGNCYAKGIGVDIDMYQAHKLWIKSAILNNDRAEDILRNKYNITILKIGHRIFNIQKNNLTIAQAELLGRKTIIIKEKVDFENIFSDNQINQANNINTRLHLILFSKEYFLAHQVRATHTTENVYKLYKETTKNNDFNSTVIVKASFIDSVFQIVHVKIPIENSFNVKDFTQKALCNGFVYSRESEKKLIRNQHLINDTIAIYNDTIICTSSACK